MLFGADLIKSLEKENEMLMNSIDDRRKRIDDGWTDMDDCFISQRVEERGIRNNNDKIALIKSGGLHWFRELATADGIPVESRWVETRFGSTRRVEMPDGSVVWTSSLTDKGLARKGLKKSEVPASRVVRVPLLRERDVRGLHRRLCPVPERCELRDRRERLLCSD